MKTDVSSFIPHPSSLILSSEGIAMSETTDPFNPFDPTGLFKEMRTAGMDAWSKMMIQLVHTEAYAQATAAVLDAWLSGSAPFRSVPHHDFSRVSLVFWNVVIIVCEAAGRVANNQEMCSARRPPPLHGRGKVCPLVGAVSVSPSAGDGLVRAVSHVVWIDCVYADGSRRDVRRGGHAT